MDDRLLRNSVLGIRHPLAGGCHALPNVLACGEREVHGALSHKACRCKQYNRVCLLSSTILIIHYTQQCNSSIPHRMSLNYLTNLKMLLKAADVDKITFYAPSFCICESSSYFAS
jgi:hypothetical protein